MAKASSIIKCHASKEIRKLLNVEGNVTLPIPISLNYLPYHEFCQILREGKGLHLTDPWQKAGTAKWLSKWVFLSRNNIHCCVWLEYYTAQINCWVKSGQRTGFYVTDTLRRCLNYFLKDLKCINVIWKNLFSWNVSHFRNSSSTYSATSYSNRNK